MLKAEEILQIDTFTECGVPEEEEEEEEKESQAQFHHQFTEGSAYNNVSLLGVPYAVSSMAPPPPPPLPPGGHAEGDSGCWLEKYCPMYCNEYCTLSAFQKGPTGTAEHRGAPYNQSLPDGGPQSGGRY